MALVQWVIFSNLLYGIGHHKQVYFSKIIVNHMKSQKITGAQLSTTLDALPV